MPKSHNVSYSGKWDIVQAVNKIIKSARDITVNITPELLQENLSTHDIPDPDLLIRTSGELRISNYMLWQTAYSEFYFTETLWPDFRKNEFRSALEEYAKRDRRFGKVQ